MVPHRRRVGDEKKLTQWDSEGTSCLEHCVVLRA